MMLRHKYLRLNTLNFTPKELNFWLSAYMINTFFTGFIWGITCYYLNDAPSQYYYLLFGVSVGISSAGLISLGVIPKIFYSFFIPLMGISMIWMFSQNDTFHTTIGFITLIGIAYYVAFAYRYGKSFKQSRLDKETIKENLIELQKMQIALIEEKAKIEYLANHDILTGLANRLLFTDRLEQTLLKAKRNSTKAALLFIDLDHFKEINDSFGHQTGDKVLQEVTKRLLQTTREEDSIARLGGDEFTIIMDDVKDAQGVSNLALKLINSLTKPLVIDGQEFYVSCSIGISLFPDDGDKCVDLIKYADSAMYKAKDNGRSTYMFYEQEMTKLALERLTMESQLREAIQNE